MFKQILPILVLVLTLISCQGQTKEELLKQGLDQLNQGNHNGAIVLFKNALEKDQNYVEARQELAEAYQAAGKYEKALNELLKVQLQKPSDAEVSLKLAELYTYNGQAKNALEELKKYVEVNSESSETCEIRARALLLKGQTQEATEEMKKAVALDGDNLSVRLALVQITLRQGDKNQGRSMLNEILKRDPQNVQALRLLASLEQDEGNSEQALEVYDRLIKAAPGDPRALYMSGFLVLSKGDLDKAEEISARLDNKFPNSAEAPRLSGMILFKKQEYEAASTELQRSLVGAGDAATFYFLGLSYYQLGKYELALSQFQKLLDYRPGFVAARLLVALTLSKQGRVEDSITETKRILESNGDLALAHDLLGSLLMAKGDFDEATEEINTALKLDPNMASARWKKGIVAMVGGDLEMGEKEMLRAIDLEPNALNNRIAMGNYYFRTGQMEKAITTFTQGISGQATDAVLLNNVGVVCVAQRNEEQALKYFQMAKDSKKDYLAPYFNLAAYFASKGAYSKAEGEYQAVLDQSPGNFKALLGLAQLANVTNQEDKAFEYYKKLGTSGNKQGVILLAEFYQRKGEPENALQVLNEALKDYPSDDLLLENKGRVLAGAKHYKEAAEVFQQITMKNPIAGTAYLANVYLQSGDSAKAISSAEKLIQTHPKEPFGYLILSQIHQATGNLASAREVLGRGLEATGGNTAIRMEIGKLYERNHQPDLALKVYDEILQGAPDYIPALFSKAALMQVFGKVSEATAEYRKILLLDENHAPTLNNLAFLYAEKAGGSEEAVQLAWRAMRAAPSNPAVMDTLGYALLKNGQGEKAVAVLEKAVKYLPGNPEVKKHLEEAQRVAGKEPKKPSSVNPALTTAKGSEKEVTSNQKAD